jgi:hypothetical protein
MALITENFDDAFRIGVLGPSRVGKSSLIAAILRDSQDVLAGTSVEIQSDEVSTHRRLAQYRKQLDGSLHAGQFSPDAMHPNQESFVFVLRMFAGERQSGLRMALLDYPGGWLDPEQLPELRHEEWTLCRDFISDSTVLVVPIDAAVMMEAAEPRHRAAVPSILTTGEVVEVARSWATKRHERVGREPGVLVLSPLKCESYFSDNGGLRDASAELEAEVRKAYGDLIRTVRKEAPSVTILYAPVDTIGCVELVTADWHRVPESPDAFEFNAKYRVRHPHHQQIKGADAPLTVVCKHMADAKQALEQSNATRAQSSAAAAHEYAVRHEGVLKDLWLRIKRERKRRLMTAHERSHEAELARRRLAAFDRAVDELARRPHGSRVVEL